MTEQITNADRANGLVKGYMLGALGVGLVPYPGVDMAVLVAVQLKMLHSLAKIYAIEFSDELAKEVVTACLGGVIPVSLSSQLSRFIPVYGVFIKGVSTAAFSGAFTYAVGKLFIQHFESGCTFLTLDPHQVKAHFATQFEQGKVEVNKNFVGIKP
jgi:uncharacterized protein (DUF697 family)